MTTPYDWKKTVVKVLEICLFGSLGALISYLTGLPPTPTIVFVIAVAKAAENYLKHH